MNIVQLDKCIPAMTDAAIAKVRELGELSLQYPQVDIPTDHVIHAGIYSRTIRILKGVTLTGVLIKIPTTLVFSGDAAVFTGGDVIRLQGYHVLPAHAGRQQAFEAYEDTYLTMSFATSAKTVAEAEEEFTDFADILFSRRGENRVTITGV